MTYRASASTDDLVERKSVRDAIWATATGGDGFGLSTFLGVEGLSRVRDIGRTTIVQRENHFVCWVDRGRGRRRCRGGDRPEIGVEIGAGGAGRAG